MMTKTIIDIGSLERILIADKSRRTIGRSWAQGCLHQEVPDDTTVSTSPLSESSTSSDDGICDHLACGKKPNQRDLRLAPIYCRGWFHVIIYALLVQSLGCHPYSKKLSYGELARFNSRVWLIKEFLQRGHSHNDYHQTDPLSSALRHGIKSIEVDVFPRNGDLWVAHTVLELDSTRRIGNLYIDPLRSLIQAKRRAEIAAEFSEELAYKTPFPTGMRTSEQGRSNPSRHLIDLHSDVIHLLVDFKGDAEKSVMLLQQAIEPLRPYLSRVDKNGKFHQGEITVIVSGNRPRESSLISKMNSDRFVFVDGRERDLRKNTDTSLVPLVSIPWRNIQLAYAMGRGEEIMQRMVRRAHEQGKRLRIWGAPNREDLWLSMVRSNVDLLSIDDHPKYLQFSSSLRDNRVAFNSSPK